jgi:CDGSH-type Zn-finger protein
MEDKTKDITEFTVIDNGPLAINGNFKLVNSEGREISSEREIYLCRCGGSDNKPFCDGNHKKNGFKG